jgi:hypothetical protein
MSYRRVFLGVEIAENDQGRVAINRLLPQGSARGLALRAGDAIVTIDGKPRQGLGEALAAIGEHRGGSTLKLTVASLSPSEVTELQELGYLATAAAVPPLASDLRFLGPHRSGSWSLEPRPTIRPAAVLGALQLAARRCSLPTCS